MPLMAPVPEFGVTAASFYGQDLGRQAVVLGWSVCLHERRMMSPPLPGQHANLSGCQDSEAGFCSKEGNSTPLAELEFRLHWSAGS